VETAITIGTTAAGEIVMMVETVIAIGDRDRWRHRRGDGDHDWDDGYRNRNWGYGPNRTWGYSPNGTYYPYAGQRAGVTVTAPVICTLESASPALSRISLGGLPLLPDANHPPRPRH
jgi:hypothetical protein